MLKGSTFFHRATYSNPSSSDYVLQVRPLTQRHSTQWIFSTSQPTQPTLHLINLAKSSDPILSGKLTLSQKWSSVISDRIFQATRSPKGPLGSKPPSFRVNELNWSEQNGLVVASFTGLNALMGWDLRVDHVHPVLEFESVREGSFLSCDQAPNHLVGSSTSVTSSGPSHREEYGIEGFDVRKPAKSLFRLAGVHADEITQVRFCDNNRSVVSGGLDGLVVSCDLGKATGREGEAHENDDGEGIAWMCNVGTSIGILCPIKSTRSIWVGTDIETVAVYQVDQSRLLEHGDISIHPEDLADVILKDSSPTAKGQYQTTDYLISCLDLSSTRSPGLFSHQVKSAYFAGNRSGEVILIDASDEVMRSNWGVLTTLKGGHRDIVRCAIVDEQKGLIGTGGEDGRLCVWSLADQENVQESDLATRKLGLKRARLEIEQEQTIRDRHPKKYHEAR